MQLNSLSIRFYKTLEKNTVSFIYIPLGIYWLALFILTTIPADSIPRYFIYQDKLEHILAYYLLALLLSLCFHFQKKINIIKKHSFLATMIFIIFYALIDEIHQIYIPGRYCDFYDWLADVMGGFFGVFIAYIFIKNYFQFKANYNTL